ncbi:stimulated by retinoic acid gene 6 protein-like isoform X2 [Ptychodera flava]|uniref:stimulated by retinoic acid gene 6 protein-like isoform X2 n=1 Tax=Ptychodera flava TaxID=63121 RepID=UPI00396A56CF
MEAIFNGSESPYETTESTIGDGDDIIREVFAAFLALFARQSTEAMELENHTGYFTNDTLHDDPCNSDLYIAWFELSFIPAVLIFIIMTFLQKRKRMCQNSCHGYPGIAYPANVIDADRDRLSYACAFGATTVCVLGLLGDDYWINVDVYQVNIMLQGTILIIVKMLNVILVGLIFYPIFACLSTKQKIVGNVIGILYTVFWLTYYTLNFIRCSELGGKAKFSLWIVIVTDVPNIICLVILAVRFVVGIILDIKHCCSRDSKEMTKKDDFRKSHHYIYVKRLFTSPKGAPSTCWNKLRKLMYQNKPGFKYSTRIVCTMTVAGIVLLQVSSIWSSFIELIILIFKEFSEDPKVTLAFQLSNATEIHSDLKDFLDATFITFEFSYIFTLALHYLFLILMLVSYRQHMLLLYRGKKSHFPRQKLTPASTLVYSWRYAGYQVAYLMWSWFLWHLVLWIACLVLLYAIIFPLMKGDTNILLDFIKSYWLTLVIGFALIYFQVLLAKLFFLQERGRVLGANNRRLFYVMFYVLFYYDMVIGLFSCLLRIVYAVVFGLLYLGRTDNGVLMRKFELWDPGYKAYYGFLMVEECHTHPVLVTFSNLLQESLADTLDDEYGMDASVQCNPYVTDKETANSTHEKKIDARRRKRIRNMWHLTYTLIKNPDLTKLRRTVPVEKDTIEAGAENEGMMMDALESGVIVTMMADQN